MSETMIRPETRTLLLNSADNIAVALANLDAGSQTAQGRIIAKRVPKGHKFTVRAVRAGEAIVKFGQIIGFASVDIAAGDWVHEHNCGMGGTDGSLKHDYAFAEGAIPPEMIPLAERATFQGYRRANGSVGTRNYVGILTSVNCSATVAKFIAEGINRSGILEDYPEINGVVPFVHGTGCGMESRGEGFDILQRTQWGYASNPNLGAAMLVGLGCEVFQIGRMKETYGIVESDTFQTMTIQERGGTRKIVEWGIEQMKE
ncbi:MAG TPA: UxaA family hydrolase, partial [Devosia sp.]|nr:UxaA family hydrolase [Devosia sp.]